MKRSLSVVLILTLAVTLVCGDSDSLAECIGYCETYWGDTDSDPLTPMLDEGAYRECIDTCKEIR